LIFLYQQPLEAATWTLDPKENQIHFQKSPNKVGACVKPKNEEIILGVVSF
jgi:hypothetical protein